MEKQNKRKYIYWIIFLFIIIFSSVGYLFLKENSPLFLREAPLSHSEYIFGLDVSHYQGRINWKRVSTSKHPIKYVFIRSTMGINGKDKQFLYNWRKAKDFGYIRGAYHYYRPNENPESQFLNYKKMVRLNKGDFIPILDVEQMGRKGRKRLRQDISIWLKMAEKEYGVKPMVYTGLHFYKRNLKGHINDYPLWVASYNRKFRIRRLNWTFHQFTDRVRVEGIKVLTDGNDFNGSMEQLLGMCLK